MVVHDPISPCKVWYFKASKDTAPMAALVLNRDKSLPLYCLEMLFIRNINIQYQCNDEQGVFSAVISMGKMAKKVFQPHSALKTRSVQNYWCLFVSTPPRYLPASTDNHPVNHGSSSTGLGFDFPGMNLSSGPHSVNLVKSVNPSFSASLGFGVPSSLYFGPSSPSCST